MAVRLSALRTGHALLPRNIIFLVLISHNEEFPDLYSSSIIIRMIKSRRMRWAEHVARMGKKNAYRLLMGKLEGKRPLGRPRRRWVDNIKMDLGVMGCGDVDWIGLAQDRNRRRDVVNATMNLRVP
jgi:hypothetical protein